MTVLLLIEASPRIGASRSRAAADLFLVRLGDLDPNLSVDRLDLWAEHLPELDGAALSAKYARLAGREHEPDEADAWAGIARLVERMVRADKIVVATPMWNLSVPYKLKQFIDLVTQPGLTFRFDPRTGYTPLLKQRPLLVVMASAGDFAGGSSFDRPDLATPYLSAAFAFMGLRDARFVGVGPTAGPAEPVAAGFERARRQLIALASDF